MEEGRRGGGEWERGEGRRGVGEGERGRGKEGRSVQHKALLDMSLDEVHVSDNITV